MNITIYYTLEPTRREEYYKLLNTLYPTKPLYIFLAVSMVLLIPMAVQHFSHQSSQTLVFMSISLLCMLLGGAILHATKKSLPKARAYVESNLGKNCCYTFSDTSITITSENEELVYLWSKFIGQYYASSIHYYVFCFAERTQMIPVFIGITPENVEALNTIVSLNNGRGVKLKALKVK